MLFRFRSQATAELVMLETDAKAALRLLGKEIASDGVISPEQLSRAITVLQQAADADQAQRQKDNAAWQDDGQGSEEGSDPGVYLSQRLVPLVRMLQQAHDEGKAVTWSGG